MNQNHKVERFMNMLSFDKELGYDVETGGIEPGDQTPLDWKRGNICGYSLSDGVEAIYIPVRHKGGGNIENVANFEQELNTKIKLRKKPLVGHNIKFDYHFSENHGVILNNNIKDTMVREALIDENRRSYNLENVCKNYDVAQKKGKDLYIHIANKFGIKSTRDSMGYFYMLAGDDPIADDYASTDTLSTIQVYEKQSKGLYAQRLDLLDDMESKLTYVLQKMERRGVGVDLNEFDKIAKQIEILRHDAYLNIPLTEDMEIINVKSSKSLQEYFEHCEIMDWPMTEPTDRFPNGQPSFNKDYLSTFDEGLNILNARKYDTFTSMFLEPFPRFVFNDKIHPRFNQAIGEFGGARPGRLSCADPNMQFVPKRDKELAKIFRKAFVVSSNKYTLVELDYSQAEPRLFAHYSGEKILIEGYLKTPAVDMHSVAAEYMGVDRKTAKNLNLGILYSLGAAKLGKKLGISFEQAKNIVNKWYTTFPKGKSLTKNAAKMAEERGYVFTLLGRRARFNDPRWSYRALNRIIQGGSADILKYKMVEIDRILVQENLEDEIRMLLTIHDSLVFEILTEKLQEHIKFIKNIMEDVQGAPFNLKVPFVAEYKYGSNWAEASNFE